MPKQEYGAEKVSQCTESSNKALDVIVSTPAPENGSNVT